MGCGASKSADPGIAPAEKAQAPAKKEIQKEIPPTKDVVPKKESKADGADQIGANFDAAAAVTVATGTAALVAGTVSSDARGAMGSAAAVAGQGLLAFAKELPWVAPIAFLIAGVVQASAEVHSLKADAKVFCKNVQSCEAILQEVASKGHLEHVRESVEALQYTMEEGLAFCQRLRMQYFITQLIMSGRDTVKFREISNSLHRQVSVIAAAASINAQSVIVDDFQQGEQLKAKLEELGGAAAVAADPDKMAQCTSFLKASDELMLGAINSVEAAVRLEAQKSRRDMEQMKETLLESQKQQTKVLEDQVNKLTTMMEALLMAKAGPGVDFSQPTGVPVAAPPPAPPPAPAPEAPAPEPAPEPEAAPAPESEAAPEAPALEPEAPAPEAPATEAPAVESPAPLAPEAVAAKFEETVNAEQIRAYMKTMPTYDNEAERLVAVKEAGLETADVTDTIGADEFTSITKEAMDEFGVCTAYIGSIDGTRQTYQSWRQKHLDGSVQDHAGLWLPNKFGMCKHTVKANDVVVANGSMAENTLEGMPMFSAEEMQSMAMAGDKEMGRIFGDVQQMMEDPEGKVPNEQLTKEDWSPHGENGMTYGKVRGFFGNALPAWTPQTHYTGIPIKVGGETVATFCVIDGKQRDDINVDKMKEYAARAQKVMEERATARKAAQAA